MRRPRETHSIYIIHEAHYQQANVPRLRPTLLSFFTTAGMRTTPVSKLDPCSWYHSSRRVIGSITPTSIAVCMKLAFASFRPPQLPTHLNFVGQEVSRLIVAEGREGAQIFAPSLRPPCRLPTRSGGYETQQSGMPCTTTSSRATPTR